MKRDKGHKKEKILQALSDSDGLWVREIARRTGLDKSTVSRHLTEMEGIESEFMGRNRIFRLK